jgi:hypothetical protein
MRSFGFAVVDWAVLVGAGGPTAGQQGRHVRRLEVVEGQGDTSGLLKGIEQRQIIPVPRWCPGQCGQCFIGVETSTTRVAGPTAGEMGS